MKLLKNIAITLLVIFVGIWLALKIPTVQTHVFKTLAKMRFAAALGEEYQDALSATVCGSGSPLASTSAQACIIIQAGKDLFIVDAGDGSAANLSFWNTPLENLKAVFITHNHSDHISDLADIHLMSWVTRERTTKLLVFGPEGIKDVADGFELAHKHDYEFRNAHHGDLLAPLDVVGFNPITIQDDSVIYDNGDLQVTAFRVEHEPVDPAYGFRFDYKGRSIVISGDTSYSENLIKNSQEVDVLFHEAISLDLTRRMSKIADELGEQFNSNVARNGSVIFKDIESYHTPPLEVAEIASLSKVDLLVYYHLIPTPQPPLDNLMANIFFRGVTQKFSNWEYAIDGSEVILPIGSKKIVFNK